MNDSINKNQQIEPDTPVQFLKGVGPARAKVFEELGVRNVADLLEYYPRDWRFAPECSRIADVKVNQEVTIRALVESTDLRGFRRRAMFEAYVSDESGTIRIVWFNGGYLQGKLLPGMTILATGKIAKYKHQLQMTNPKFTICEQTEDVSESDLSGAVYPATANLSSRQIRRIIEPLIDRMDGLTDEFFSPEFMRDQYLLPRAKALQWIHRPDDEDQIKDAKRRLKYDELFLMQLGLALRRYRNKHFSSAVAMQCAEQVDRRIRKRFPFLLTEDQDRVIEEIVSDMQKNEPMNRLLQGDVGSGKTVVALYAALLAVANGMQVAIMAPTEILANQHFLSIERYLRKSKVKRLCLTGGLTGAGRKEVLSDIKNGETDIVVGTVALLQKDVEFKKLGLVIIDEQHKFGVEQRAKIRKKTTPHCLVMTATPIPRTLAMTAFGDLDVSVIQHCPPGRGAVVTRKVEPEDRAKAYEFIRERLRVGRQAYFVYPRIASVENGENVKAAVDEHLHLSKKVFAEYNVELLHGQMPADEKKRIMNAFRAGKIQALVSTVVIEVGVDVPNATIMVIEGADRFGLAQLHQLRGRIGRGSEKSYCLLFSESESEISAQRLSVLERTNDGFRIAEQDLAIRGPGELFSTRQHGLPDLKIANIVEDYDLLVMARKHAMAIAENDPMLSDSSHKAIRAALIHKFGDSLPLAGVA